MKTNWILATVIGIIIGTSMFPMIMIPLMGIGVVLWALYLLVHDVIIPKVTGMNPNKRKKQDYEEVS